MAGPSVMALWLALTSPCGVSHALGASLWEIPEARLVRVPSDPIQVAGLGWFAEDAPVLRRLPERVKDRVSPAVWSLAQHPSGARLRFRTDSTRLGLVAKNPDASTMHHMTSVGQNGFDLYVDGQYRNSAWPDAKGLIQREWALGEGHLMREVTLYLPLYKAVSIERLVLDPGAMLAAPTPMARPRPVVFYGSSITQGGCAENPGLSYTAILGRSLNLDFINLGFSGAGLGEPAVAEAVAEIDAEAFVLDYWANPSPEVYRDTLPGFVDTVRRRHPRTPILVTGPFWFPAEAGSAAIHAQQESKRKTAREFVAARRKAGDREIVFVDGLEMLSRSQSSGLVDGVHPNSLGFQWCANGLEPQLRRALKLPSKRR
jgi:lysophospholipase L1-like esterase